MYDVCDAPVTARKKRHLDFSRCLQNAWDKVLAAIVPVVGPDRFRIKTSHVLKVSPRESFCECSLM